MNIRAFKAIFLKAFGRNGNGGAKASGTTFMISVVFILAFIIMVVNIFASYWINHRNSREGYKRVVVINAPESFNEYILTAHPEIRDNIRRYPNDAAYNYSKYSSLMEKNEAFMTIFFPEDFDKTVKKGEPAQILTYILSDKLKYTTWHENFLKNIMNGYQDYLKIEADVTVTREEIYSSYQKAIDTEGKGIAEYITGYIAKTIIPLLAFVVMLYIGMSKGTNVVAGQKEKGTLTAVLLTPVRVRTIVTGNLTGITLATMIPALILYPLICFLPFFFSISGLLYGIILIVTLALLISSVTLMISVMNDTVVAAQTAFLPVFFIILGVCIMCMQGVDDVARFYYWIPVYGHFYGIGQSLLNEDIQMIDVAICCGSTAALSILFAVISGFLMKTERFSTTVESYSDRQAAKYRKQLSKQIERTSRPPKAVIFGYVPTEYVTSPKLLRHHIRFPLVVLSIVQILAMIPAVVIISSSTFFHDIIDTAKNLREPGEIVTSVFDLFSLFMSHPAFIFFMGIGYYALIATYFIKVRFFEKNKISTMGLDTTVKKGIIDYLEGMILGLVMMGAVVLLLVVSGTAKLGDIGIPEGSVLLFFIYILMWIPQGFSEELMFRGYMMPRLSPRFGKAFAVFFSSLLFGIFHAANRGFTVLALINLILIAVAYALICLYKDSILMTAAAHSIWNFAQGNLFGLEVSGNTSTASILHTTYAKGVSSFLSGGEFGPEGSIFVTLVSLITIGIVFFLLKRKAAKKGSD